MTSPHPTVNKSSPAVCCHIRICPQSFAVSWALVSTSSNHFYFYILTDLPHKCSDVPRCSNPDDLQKHNRPSSKTLFPLPSEARFSGQLFTLCPCLWYLQGHSLLHSHPSHKEATTLHRDSSSICSELLHGSVSLHLLPADWWQTDAPIPSRTCAVLTGGSPHPPTVKLYFCLQAGFPFPSCLMF